MGKKRSTTIFKRRSEGEVEGCDEKEATNVDESVHKVSFINHDWTVSIIYFI